MDRGRHVGRTPFFICAGMFGNILNLRHLALQIGNDRPVYGLQARGIYGGQAPHETFQDMAAANIAEMRTIQPHGPYLIGGFSGGGLVAYEMAQQLRAMGETTSIVVLLDTPYPDDPVLSVPDRLLMKWQDFQREGTSFVSNWLRNKLAWKQRLRQSQDALSARTSDQLHNEEIEAAFRRALGRYRGEAYTAPVLLMRPKLEVSYRITGNRELNHERSLLRSDNGWTPFASDLTVIEVPGDHDGMVLEPYVRVMAGHLRSALKTADRAGAALMLAAS
jgi:thioesterase domain-containing protein